MKRENAVDSLKKMVFDRKTKIFISTLIGLFLFLFVEQVAVYAQANANTFNNNEIARSINNLWVLVAGIFVLSMQLGFAMIEAGFNAHKNIVNVLFKNIMDACVGILMFYAFGYALMYYPDNLSAGSFLFDIQPRAGAEHISVHIDFFFQAVFAATAATICSGAVAGRIKPQIYLLLAVLITGLIYPIAGHCVWGGWWLSKMGFHDFAGSLVVHATGGGAALAAILLLEARTGRYKFNPSVMKAHQFDDMIGHSLPLSALGMFILWIGWYGFNAGSTLDIIGPKTELVGLIVVNTTLSACSGAVSIILIKWFRRGFLQKNDKPDLATIMNGLLGGLVAVTACCDLVSPPLSILIGSVSGAIVMMGISYLDSQEIDDVVGAVSVHGFCGIWGGIATGIFTEISLPVQILGSAVIPLWSFLITFVILYFIKQVYGIRVSLEEELKGLDFSEHGEISYILPYQELED